MEYTNSQNIRRLRPVIYALIALIILILGWSTINYFRHKGMVKTTVIAIPEDSTITVEGEQKKSGTIYLKPGIHTLIASRQYFDNDELKVDTKDIVSSEVIYLLPKANSDQAKQWLVDHPDTQKQRETAGGAMSARSQRIITSQYPILNQLPFENEHFKVDYSVSEIGKPEFTVSLFGIINRPNQYPQYVKQLQQYKQEALSYLLDNKIDPGSYRITYIPNVPEQ